MKRRPRVDSSGAANIPLSPLHRDQRDIQRSELARARGIQPICWRCPRTCKVLRGTKGMRGKLICYDAPESAR